MDLQIHLMHLLSVVSSPLGGGGERPGCKCIFGVFKARGTCLLASSVVLFLFSEISKLKQMWLIVNELYVTVWLLFKSYVIILYILFH